MNEFEHVGRKSRRRIIVFTLVVALVGGGSALAWGTARYGTRFARENPTVTLLPQGDILFAGGFASPVWVGGLRLPRGAPSATAERYDPATGQWHGAKAMTTPRLRHTATLLGDGRVLVVGGVTTLSDSSSTALATAEIYDPHDDSWTIVSSLHAPRYDHTATLLGDGRVLVAGGRDYVTGADAFAEVYDPATDRWQRTAPMRRDRRGHSATLLADRRVLIVGGHTALSYFDTSAEIYDPATDAWGAASAMNAGRRDHSATPLASGSVLVAGGTGAMGKLSSIELYDSARNTWAIGSTLTTPRAGHTATLLPTGNLLLIGGDEAGRHATTEQYNPASGAWQSERALNHSWYQHAAILLPTGKIVIAGGGVMREIVETYGDARRQLATSRRRGDADVSAHSAIPGTGSSFGARQGGHGVPRNALHGLRPMQAKRARSGCSDA